MVGLKMIQTMSKLTAQKQSDLILKAYFQAPLTLHESSTQHSTNANNVTGSWMRSTGLLSPRLANT